MEENQLKYAANPTYQKYESLLKQLHDLNKAGKYDSDEADKVRDQMEFHWFALSPEEHSRLRGLSADLYSLSDEEASTILTIEEEGELNQQIRQAMASSKWEEALSLLRKGPQIYPHWRLAGWRARCWYELGHLNPACWFWLYATAHF